METDSGAIRKEPVNFTINEARVTQQEGQLDCQLAADRYAADWNAVHATSVLLQTNLAPCNVAVRHKSTKGKPLPMHWTNC